MSSPLPLLTKDSINIGGHKLPLALVGAVVGVLGLVVVLRARSQGASVASVGSAAGVPTLDTSAQNSQDLANLGLQLTGITQQLQGITSTGAPATAPPPVPTPSSSGGPVLFQAFKAHELPPGTWAGNSSGIGNTAALLRGRS